MKLYYTPGACSLSPHIVANEAGVQTTLVKVDLRTHTTESGEDYYAINPKGPVPALALETGEVLTEGPAIVQYLAEHGTEPSLMPAVGTLERYRVLEWLAYINSEFHKAFGPLFSPSVTDEAREAVNQKLTKIYSYLNNSLEGKQFLTGDIYTVADAYCFTISRWNSMTSIDMNSYPNLAAYIARVAARPAVQKAMQEEGIA